MGAASAEGNRLLKGIKIALAQLGFFQYLRCKLGLTGGRASGKEDNLKARLKIFHLPDAPEHRECAASEKIAQDRAPRERVAQGLFVDGGDFELQAGQTFNINTRG